MSRWLRKADIYQATLDSLNLKPTTKVKTEEQGDLFDPWYTKTYEKEVQVPQKQYNLKIYNTDNFGYLLNNKHRTNWQIADEMNFNKVVSQKDVTLSSDKFEALKQIRNFIEDNTKPFDVVKITLDNEDYYLVNCTENSGLGTAICKDDLAAAGKLNQYLFILNR